MQRDPNARDVSAIAFRIVRKGVNWLMIVQRKVQETSACTVML